MMARCNRWRSPACQSGEQCNARPTGSRYSQQFIKQWQQCCVLYNTLASDAKQLLGKKLSRCAGRLSFIDQPGGATNICRSISSQQRLYQLILRKAQHFCDHRAVDCLITQ